MVFGSTKLSFSVLRFRLLLFRFKMVSNSPLPILKKHRQEQSEITGGGGVGGRRGILTATLT